jgi:integrase
MPRHYQRPMMGLYETAMRVNELLGLTWDRVSEKDGFIRLRAADVKEKQPRSVPISSNLQAVFPELRTEQKASKVVNLSGRVFTRPNGRAIDSIRKPFEAACREAKIDDLHLHDFRHTCITRWAMEGKPVGAVMAASGHHSFSMHDSYVNLREHHLRTAFLLTGRLHEKDVDESKSVRY